MLTQHEQKKVPILMYHSISDHAGPKFKPFTVAPTLFSTHMEYLHQHGYTPITVTQFIQARDQGLYMLPRRPIVLTFDDGFADFYTSVLPILKEHHFTATLYITTGYINDTSRWLKRERETTRCMLTWEQLAEIRDNGIECGAHSHTHPQLDTLPLITARYEIMGSKMMLEQHLKQRITTFAYPYGYYTATLQKLVREAGYTSACAVKHAMSSEITDPLALARITISANTDIGALASLITGRKLSGISAMYMQARTPVWQVVRRMSSPVAQNMREGIRLSKETQRLKSTIK